MVILVLVILGCIEVAAMVAGKQLARRGLIYDPPVVVDYAQYLEARDPVLGWPSPRSFGSGEIDHSGARITPRFPDPATPNCGVVFGDSFTWGDEVGPEHAYANVLSDLAGCRVANFGVGGYGTDQALLRFETLRPQASGFAILGHYADNITRNLSQERAFMANRPYGLKPRFRLDDNGKLELLPLPQLTETEYASLARDAKTLLPSDYFVPGGASGVQVLHFPHLLSVAKSLNHYRIRARLKGEPSFAAFYDPDHRSGALDLTEAIMRRFAEGARAQGLIAMVLLVPDHKDFVALGQGSEPAFSSLANRLRGSGMVVPDVVGQMAQMLDGADPCSLYASCPGHFNPAGYALLAQIAFSELRAQGWNPSEVKASLQPP